MTQAISTREVTLLFLLSASFHFLTTDLFQLGFYIDLMLVATVYVANYSEPSRALLLGCVFGLTEDILGFQPMWGLNGFSKTLIAYVSCYLIRYLVVESMAGRACLLFLLTLLDSAIIYGFLALLMPPLPGDLVSIVILRAVLTTMVGVALFAVLDLIRLPPKDFRNLST